MKEYWLVLHPDTFLWIKGNKGLVYNSRNYEMFHFENDDLLGKLIDELLKLESLYRVTINDQDLSTETVKNWVNGLLQTDSAILIENDGSNERPVSLKPELRVQDTIVSYKSDHNQSVGGRIMTNLHQLTFHINGSHYGNSFYSRQIIYPQPEGEEMKLEDICRFITSFGDTSFFLPHIALVGCLWQYSANNDLLAFLHSLKVNVTVYCTEHDFLKYRDTQKGASYDNVTFHILISDYNIDYSILLNETQPDISISYGFIVTSENDYECANQLIECYELSEKSRIYPLYTTDNLVFLEENLYMNEDLFENIDLSKREIFAHQVINTNFFGTLTVFSDGNVFAGNVATPIGRINESLYTIVYREMTEGDSWFQTRSQEPCKSCVYQLLCPSPSTYEQIIGVPNLCHIAQ